MTTDFAWIGAMGQSTSFKDGMDVGLAWSTRLGFVSHPAGIVSPIIPVGMLCA